MWTQLATRGQHSFFQSWHWIGTWLDCLPAARAPRLLIGRRAGAVVALGVVTQGRRRLMRCLPVVTHHLNDSGDPDEAILTIEHNGLLVDPSLGATAIRQALAWAVEEGGIAELHMPGMPLAYAHAAAGASGTDARVLMLADHYVDLDDLRRQGLDHSQAVSSNTRQQIKRAIKAAGGERLRLDRAGGIGEALDWLDRLAALHQAYWQERGKPGAFANPFFRRFHRQMIERCFDAGAIELLRVSAGGEDLGYLYNLAADGVISAYQSGLAYGSVPKLRPGAVGHALAIAAAHRAGAKRYDFLAGDSQFKRSFATHSQELAWIVMARRSPLVRLEQWLRRVRKRLDGIR